MKKTLTAALVIVVSLAHLTSALVTAARPGVLAAALIGALDRSGADQPLNVIITLRDQADISKLDRAAVPDVLQRHAARTQADLLAALKAQPTDRVRSVASLWIDNALVVSVLPAVIVDLAQRADVARIQLDERVQMSITPTRLKTAPDNLTAIGVPAVWQRGITGQGVVVAVLDSGVDLQNADLAAKWRGGSNSWFDPYGEHDTPVDLSGHGTQVLGVILGGEDNGTPIGVAPGAKWIAARIFNDRGRATTSAIHRALQWVLDPDGNPATDDAPQVVNNSWSAANPGCNADFAADLRALRAAGILPIFAAGTNQAVSPANQPEAFAVGAVTDDAAALADSAQGPSACLAPDEVYPQLVAPGENIHTTNHYGAYITAAGTSLAAAHVSGALALLLSIKPQLSAAEQAQLLTDTAADLGESGPDNTFGYGRLNVAALIDRAAPSSSVSVLTPLELLLGGASLIGLIAALLGLRRAPAAEAKSNQGADHSTWQDLD